MSEMLEPRAPERLLPPRQARVWAVIVTHNRKDLLRECLTAVQAQTLALARVLVVDNVSTDGTPELLACEFAVPSVEHLRLATNVGGAGGVQEGLKRVLAENSRAHSPDWVWVMDDDTIPQPDALAALMAAHDRLAAVGDAPVLLASKVLWTDGSMHWMNLPVLRLGDAQVAFRCAALGALPLRTASFVSVLIASEQVRRHGFPVADYFIAGDDFEYTGRILRRGFGVAVLDSVVLHKTARNYTAFDGLPDRVYYHVRNALWFSLRSRAWTLRERIVHVITLLQWIYHYLRRRSDREGSVAAVLTAVRDGLFKKPVR